MQLSRTELDLVLSAFVGEIASADSLLKYPLAQDVLDGVKARITKLQQFIADLKANLDVLDAAPPSDFDVDYPTDKITLKL